jgi:RNA polymerase sigma-70 factor (ECF subfamily)
MAVSADAQLAFSGARPGLLALARSVAGSHEDAEDVVQDTWIRWSGVDHTQVRDASAFLSRVARNLALNVVQSAWRRREVAVSDRLDDDPAGGASPADLAERAEALEAAAHLALERLTGLERAAFVLREGFDYPHTRVAEVLVLREATARQLAARARRSLAGGRRAPVDPVERRRLAATIARAARSGAVRELEQLLVTNREGARSAVHVSRHSRLTPAAAGRSAG